MTSEVARKLDILLDLKTEGFNLIEGESPEIMTMVLGGGYTLECDIRKRTDDWKISFNDGVETTEYPADSVQVIYTYRKGSDDLIKAYNKKYALNAENVESKSSTKKTGKHKNKGLIADGQCVKLPIVYPSEMDGSFMKFKQWSVDNDVIPKNSEVVLLDEDEYNFKVVIPQAHISFDISKEKAEVVTTDEVEVEV